LRVTDDGSPTLVQTATDDSMHSGCGALAETRHVYLEGCGVGDALRRGRAMRVLEVGFGSGLGWLLTADLAITRCTPLFYHGLENQLAPTSVLRQLDLGRFVQTARLVETFLEFVGSVHAAGVADGQGPQTFQFTTGPATLSLHLGDAANWCADDAAVNYSEPDNRFDAVYFDPFSPETSPRLWQTDIFAAILAVTRPDGVLASYCVNRQARDALAAAGWRIGKFAGPPGGKREVLRAWPGDSPGV
jgi:tRNA U34 5-methylaminomethyl-2-thiouridine-forming methyltransferase MnmC